RRTKEQVPDEEAPAFEQRQPRRSGRRRLPDRVREARVDQERIQRRDPDPRRRDVDRYAPDRGHLEPVADRHPPSVLQRVSFTFRAPLSPLRNGRLSYSRSSPSRSPSSRPFLTAKSW